MVITNVSQCLDKVPVSFSFEIFVWYTVNIIIFEGSVSTHYQTLSAESRKYFRRSICMSGSAFLPYALSQKYNHLDRIYNLARILNKSIGNFDELVAFVNNVSATNIIEHTSQREFGRTLFTDWGPVIESLLIYFNNYKYFDEASFPST